MNLKEKQFIQKVRDFYAVNGRDTLPWRKTTDPYKIAVSEIMLQQTQVDRVLPKYKAFIKKWGSARALARAPLGSVLREWQGLGYNRRAKMLHECAKRVIAEHNGKFPKTYKELCALPGIGPYTTGAIMAFAYNSPVPIIETNIRTVYLHHFFPNATDVTDAEILHLVKKTLDTENVREWYWALMDYGSFLKKEFGNPNSKSASYAKQSKFEGSDRQIRGAIISLLSEQKATRQTVHKKLARFEDIRIDAQLEKLVDENMVELKKSWYQLPTT